MPILPARVFLVRHITIALFLLDLSARADDGSNQVQDTTQPPAGVSASKTNNPDHVQDLTELSLEQLMQIKVPEVYSASKFEQKATEAPSSVTVITSDEIKHYGWRTLGDLLGSVQGFYVSYDRNYAYLGTRGVNLGDANNRILLLVNGHRINNDLNDSAAIDSSFILDVDLIDRVEIIRGPSSVLYGNNAFFGVVNVITRDGKQVNGVEGSGMYGSYNAYSGRVSIGGQFTNGLQFLLSGTLYHNDGPEDLFYPQYNTPAQNNGVAHNLDDDGFGSFFGSVSYKDFTLEGGYINRDKGNPTAQYGSTFDDSRLRTTDDRSYASFKYAHKFSDTLDVSANVYYDRSDFQIGYPQPFGAAAPGTVFYQEQETGEWAGGGVQVNKNLWDRSLLTIGGEIRDDFSQEDHLFQLEPTSGNVRNVYDQRQNYSLFAQDNFAVLTNLHLNAGVRYDQSYDRQDSFNPSWSPRVALIYDPFRQSTFKFIYGTAFRDPDFYELSEASSLNIKPQPESITSYELVYEQGIGRHLRSSVSGYYNRMDDLIDFENGTFTNFNADTLGLELALEGKWESGISTRLSYTLQHTENRDSDAGLPDSPMHLIKLNLNAPLYRDKIFAGLEVQYTSKSHTVFTDPTTGDTLPGPDSPGYAVVNFTLFSQNIIKNLDISASIYNLLDKTYYEPASNFHLQNAIQQDGRTFRIKLTYRF
ncbi:MAG TPA: TonB-dependent receptor [Candidatus Sulfopaludibacter sp.]|nr:TonB-dependent receptor [Candidatus Sulfopaludibacter sp.]